MDEQSTEMLSCIDDSGVEIAPRPRSDCHGNPEHLHRVIHVLIFDDAGRILAQKRSKTKEIQPGKWDTSVGGHVDPGETIESAAIRESREELGIDLTDLKLLYDYVWLSDIESERVYTFSGKYTGQLEHDLSEVDDVRFLSDDELAELKNKGLLTPNFEYELKRHHRWKTHGRQSETLYPIHSMCRCGKCTRLVTFRESIMGKGKLKGAEYWNKPVPGFGDLDARFLIVGLAPGAHGANRTGRPFTGDAAGDVLFQTLVDLGFSRRPVATHRGDGLWLNDVFISNAVKCVPPDNKPNGPEVRTCMTWMEQELKVLREVRGIICLGRLAYDAVKRMFKAKYPEKTRWMESSFGHGVVCDPGPEMPLISGVYHPSRRNINTGLLTRESFAEKFSLICETVLKSRG